MEEKHLFVRSTRAASAIASNWKRKPGKEHRLAAPQSPLGTLYRVGPRKELFAEPPQASLQAARHAAVLMYTEGVPSNRPPTPRQGQAFEKRCY